jgi:hypothetical protein
MWPFFSRKRRERRLVLAGPPLPAPPMQICELCGVSVAQSTYAGHYATHVRRVLDERRVPANDGEVYRDGPPLRSNIAVYLIETPGHGDGDGWKRYSAFYALAIAKLHAAYPATAEFQCLPQRYWHGKSLGALLIIIRY